VSRGRRRLALVLAGVVVLLAAVVLASARPGDRRLFPVAAGQPAVTVYLIDNGFHTDLALPGRAVAATGGATAQAAQRISPRGWVVAGWGEAAFYEGSGFSAARLAEGLRALFVPGNPTVVHLYGIARRPDQAFGPATAVAIRLSPQGFARLAARIDRTFAPGPQLVLQPSPDEAFFRSGEPFSALKVCNTWTGEALNAAGLPVTGALDATSAGLRLDLRLRAGVGARQRRLASASPPHWGGLSHVWRPRPQNASGSSATPAPPASSPQAQRRPSAVMASAVTGGPFSAFTGWILEAARSVTQTRPSSRPAARRPPCGVAATRATMADSS
jgi:hypothetical protein